MFVTRPPERSRGGGGMTLGPQTCRLFILRTFTDSKIHQKSKTPPNLKNLPRWSRSDQFLMIFGVPSSVKFRDLQNLLNCNSYNAKTCFYKISSPSFCHRESIQEFCCFTPPSWTPFLSCHIDFLRNCHRLGPF